MRRALDRLLAGRTPRERALLGALAALLLGAGLWQGVRVPLAEARDAAARDAARHAGLIARLEAAADRPAPSAPAPPDAPAAATVAETAAAAGLAIRRLEPERGGLRVALDDAPFAALLDWIAALERDHRLIAAAVEIERRPEPGAVSARLTLERRP